MPYRAPISDYEFLLSNVVGFDQVAATDKFSEASADVVSAILSEAGKMCEEVMAPLQRPGDLETSPAGKRCFAYVNRLRRWLESDRRRRMDRDEWRSRIWRHGAADDRDHRRKRNDERGLPVVATGPFDESGADRGAGTSRERRAERAVSAQADVR